MVESERELLVTRDSPESRDCTCDEQWPEASDGACPQHGLDSILAATKWSPNTRTEERVMTSLFPDGLFEPREMERDEFYGEYIVIPTSSDEDGDAIVLFGATIEEAREIVAAVNESRLRAKCYCGYLDWTVATYGRLSHKHGCPARRDSWCQLHPEGCPT